MCLLLIEGSKLTRESLAADFRNAGYATETVGDVEQALRSATHRGHKVILLDVELPGTDWLALLRKMREESSNARIVLLTPGHSPADVVKGLNSGADDCVPRPFSFEELLARVRVLLRGPHRTCAVRIEVDDLVIETDARRVTRAGVAVRLTAREFQLLEYLGRRPGVTIPQSELEDHLHGAGNFPSSNSLASAICLLRKKLEAVNDHPIVHTRRGKGYFLGASLAN